MRKLDLSNFLLPLIGIFLVTISSCHKDDAKPKVNSFKDPRDGAVYKTVTIGSQVWMAENLKYLPSVAEPTTISETDPYYYVYGYDTNSIPDAKVTTSVTDAKATVNYQTYGVLYNWSAAMEGSTSSSANPSGVQGVCPSGWHLPSDAEWTELEIFLGNDAGVKLKNTSGWNNNGNGSNSSGFTGLPGGSLYYDGFTGIGDNGWWWSSTEGDEGFAGYIWTRRLRSNSVNILRSNDYREEGRSVRCVKD